MYNFDLKKVHDLLSFKNICTSEHEYMNEASCLPHIVLDTEPLYVIDVNTRVLFTTKLRYYRRLVQNEINRHINEVTDLLESDGSEEMTKFIQKKSREAVITLANEANRQLCYHDMGRGAWKNITSDNPIVSEIAKPTIEYVVFLHYIVAELARCMLEIQDRYAYVLGEAGCYDTSLFYTSILNQLPDPEFMLNKSEKYDDEAKKFKKGRKDCCFLYDNEEFFAVAIQGFTNKLKEHKLIPDDVDCKQMESLFSGHPCRRTYTWLGEKHILTHIIKGLVKGDKPIITTWPEGTSHWTVVSERFVDKEGKHLPNIRQDNIREKTRSVVTDVIEALASYLD